MQKFILCHHLIIIRDNCELLCKIIQLKNWGE